MVRLFRSLALIGFGLGFGFGVGCQPSTKNTNAIQALIAAPATTIDVGILNRGGSNGETYATDPDIGLWTITGSGGYTTEALLKFQALNVPAGAHVTRATLRVTFENWVKGGLTVRGRYLMPAWGPNVASGLGWANRLTGKPWTVPGARGDGTDTISGKSFTWTNWPGVGADVQSVELDVAVVQGWVDTPTSNQGLLLFNETNNRIVRLYTSEGTVKRRPTLTIAYDVAVPIDAAVPIPTDSVPIDAPVPIDASPIDAATPIIDAVPVGALVINPTQATVAPGGQQAFVVSRSDAPTPTVTWSVSGTGNGSITSAGLYTAPSTPGTYTVTAIEAGTGVRVDASVTVIAGGTPTHGMTIPAGHPRLWFNPSRLARARTWFAAHPFTPPTNEETAGGYGDVALHGLLSNNAGGSCTNAINWGLSRLGDVRATGGVACDPCRWTGEQLILVFDWCYAYLTPTQRSTYVAGMSTGLLAWSRESWGGPAMSQSNYFWGYLRNELAWAITVFGDDTATANTLLDWVFTNRLANGFNPATNVGGNSRGGVAYEGSEYGPVVGTYPLVPFVSANLLGRNVYEETAFWREAVYALIYATPPAPSKIPGMAGALGYTVFPFSDDEAWNERFQAQTHYLPDFMTAMASYWPTDNVGRHARQWANMVGITPWRQVVAVDVSNPPLAFDMLPLDFYASGPRYLYGRNAWGAASTVFMLQLGDAAGNTIGHQHGDYGTFQIWRGGRFLAHETAGYSGDSSTNVAGYAGNGVVESALGIAHNTILVDGANPGPQYSGPSAVVERLASAPGYTFAVVNLVPPANKLAGWRREFVFVRALETLVVLDRLQTSSATSTKTFVNHCETNPVVSGNTSATCTMDAQALTMTTLLPAPTQRTYRVVDEGAHVNSQYRIEVDTTPGVAQSYILTVLQARGASAASLTPTVADEGAAYTVTLNATTSITFVKGMTSVGGSIKLGGIDVPLRTGVQTMSVGAAGPVWAP